MIATAARLAGSGHGRRARMTNGNAVPWMTAWLGGPLLGIANATVRELGYRDRVGELAAHQISTATGIALFAGYFWALERRWPLPTTGTALAVGGGWTALTILFEFGFGRYVAGDSWSELLENYNLATGHVWPALLLWLLVGPALVHGRRNLRRAG
jgi:hypothetical protein